MGRVGHWSPAGYGGGAALEGRDLMNVKCVETDRDVAWVHADVVQTGQGVQTVTQSLSPNSGQCLSLEREGEVKLGRGVHEVPTIS